MQNQRTLPLLLLLLVSSCSSILVLPPICDGTYWLFIQRRSVPWWVVSYGRYRWVPKWLEWVIYIHHPLIPFVLFIHVYGAGEQENSQHIRIIDRKKNLFKLAQGEFVAYVSCFSSLAFDFLSFYFPIFINYLIFVYSLYSFSPEHVENTLLASKFVKQVFVTGSTTQSFLVAIIVPDRQAVVEWALQNNVNVCSPSPLHPRSISSPSPLHPPISSPLPSSL